MALGTEYRMSPIIDKKYTKKHSVEKGEKAHGTRKPRDVSLLLHDIRSVHNVGAIFRSAEAVGVNRVYLSGYTPGPRDRFGRVRKDFAKTSLGSERMLAWSHVDDPEHLLSELKKSGVQVIALEQAPQSVDYKRVEAGLQCLIMLGNEVKGLPKKLLNVASVIAEIPLRGKKESLNVSAAAAVFLFRLLDS